MSDETPRAPKDESFPIPHPACTSKHTKYQPTSAEFRCPKCDAKCGDFCIDEQDTEEYSCDAMHPRDYLRCYKCSYDTTGAAFVRALMNKKNIVTCPVCKGTGCVKAPIEVAATKTKKPAKRARK